MLFAAVELNPGENPENAIRHFITLAAELEVKFQRLIMFGPIEFGVSRFVRFQTDCPNFSGIVARLRMHHRGSIIPLATGGYRAFLANGREGKVGGILMQSVARPGTLKTFLGPAHQFWREQFPSTHA